MLHNPHVAINNIQFSQSQPKLNVCQNTDAYYSRSIIFRNQFWPNEEILDCTPVSQKIAYGTVKVANIRIVLTGSQTRIETSTF